MKPILRLIPAPLHHMAFRLADTLRKCWWRLARPHVTGCCVIARDSAGRVLLVRHSYGNRDWSLPTGGVGRGEDPARTALREFEEETGCALRGSRLLAVVEGVYCGTRHTEHVFTGEVFGTPSPDGREVVALQFFALDDLPADFGNGMRVRLALLSE